jgi:hypothetical protein
VAETGQYYSRPKESFRFAFRGMKTNVVADALEPGQYAWAQNIRALRNSSLRTRWGASQLFATSAGIVSDIRAYTTLGGDNDPLFIACRPLPGSTQVWLGTPPTSSLVGGLVGASAGCAMVPFRPAQSPNPWMYIANGSDYQKFSPPAFGVVTQQKVGIAEPQQPCEAAIQGYYSSIFSSNPAYAHAGVASAAVNQTRLTDTVQSVHNDPANAALETLGVTASTGAAFYTRHMIITIGGADTQVEDVFPAQPVPIGIASIYYYAGTTGHCVIVPNNMSPGPGTEGQSLYTQNLLGSLRRGSIVQFAAGDIAIVWSVTEGPDGTISFETSTPLNHTVGQTFTQPAAIQCIAAATVGQPIVSQSVGFNLSGSGIGTQTSTVSIGSPFVPVGSISFQPDDYIHISFAFVTLASLNEMKVLFDVGDGSFTQNFYFYTIRVSDIEAAVENTLTQLGAAQLVTQRATIDEEAAAASNNQLATSSSAQTTPGDGQWVDIYFPISALTRVGNEQSQTLQNVNAIQYLFNMNAATDCSIGIASVIGGFSPDVGDSGAPYLYRCRPRSSVTGAKGNPSPETRYGVTARREGVNVYLPSASYDPQIDTWDVFRYGGTITSWRKIGQTASTNTVFLDNYGDDAASAGEELEMDNLEPWPTIDVPLSTVATKVNGTVALVTILGGTNIVRYLPGTLVQIGGVNVYTLRIRPTFVSGTTYLFTFEENAGAQGAGTPVLIYEPNVANQRLPYMWGPDASGTVFAVGDPLRPGTLSFSKNYAPDNAPDSYDIEITPPSEPLLGGEIVDGVSYVASTKRWWALYPQPNDPLQRYQVVEQPITRGLAAPFGHCSDGKQIYFWAKDGIYSSAKGSLTDADLSNLFPHDGVAGQVYTYNGNTLQPPDYGQASAFRLSIINGYLYATYRDSGAAYHTLVYDILRGGWSLDVIGGAPSATVYYQPEQQSGSLVTVGADYTLAVLGTTTGGVWQEQDLANDTTLPIAAVIATMEWDGGDLRAAEEWGDLWLYLTPAAVAGVTVQPLALGAAVAPAVIIPTGATTQTPVSLGGQLLVDSLGIQLSWTDDFSTQSAVTEIQAWQPSFIPKPETIADRITDWYNAGTEAAKYVQGFLLHADTGPVPVVASTTLTSAIAGVGFNTIFVGSTAGLVNGAIATIGTGGSAETVEVFGVLPTSFEATVFALYPIGTQVTWPSGKGLVVRDADSRTTHAFTPTVNHIGEVIRVYSFNVPFVAHSMRLEPTDQLPWRFWDVEWVFEPTSEAAETWMTQGTAHGLQGYMHVKQVSPCYASDTPVTLTITSFDGQSPQPIVLPATGGAMQKAAFMLTANKGQLYFYAATSSAPFNLFLENWEIEVGGWGRQDNYLRYRNLGDPTGDQARI